MDVAGLAGMMNAPGGGRERWWQVSKRRQREAAEAAAKAALAAFQREADQRTADEQVAAALRDAQTVAEQSSAWLATLIREQGDPARAFDLFQVVLDGGATATQDAIQVAIQLLIHSAMAQPVNTRDAILYGALHLARLGLRDPGYNMPAVAEAGGSGTLS